MYKFGKNSFKRLETCHPYLKLIMSELIKVYDISILEGYRGEEKQNNYFNAGKSEVQYPNSKHNKTPSLAIDICPYPVDWKNTNRFYYMAGLVKGIAYRFGIGIRWGRDWDSDNDFKDQTFNDYPHFELI